MLSISTAPLEEMLEILTEIGNTTDSNFGGIFAHQFEDCINVSENDCNRRKALQI